MEVAIIIAIAVLAIYAWNTKGGVKLKCVADKSDLQTYRVPDREAERRVNSGRYEYATRQTWKLQGRARA